jgi:hypothetical protein
LALLTANPPRIQELWSKDPYPPKRMVCAVEVFSLALGRYVKVLDEADRVEADRVLAESLEVHNADLANMAAAAV